jgi:SAM-dependent methyltransferase
MSRAATPAARVRWQAWDAGRRYAGERWTSARKRERDPRIVAGILEELLPAGARALILDAPCGAGRLEPVIARRGRWIGLDVSLPMLREARRAGPRDGPVLRGDVERLPFRDGAFEAVVCCRLLHHLDERALASTVRELVRVSRSLVVASFWDAATLPEWRRRAFAGARPARRIARPRAEILRAFAGAGAEVVRWRHSMRFLSRQVFAAARKRAP